MKLAFAATLAFLLSVGSVAAGQFDRSTEVELKDCSEIGKLCDFALFLEGGTTRGDVLSVQRIQPTNDAKPSLYLTDESLLDTMEE